MSYIYYKTNSQAWDEVQQTIREFERSAKLCQEMFGQDNLVGLTQEQKNEFYNRY